MFNRHPVLSVPVSASGAASLRKQVREVGTLAGLEGLQQTQFSTAVSEIARNAVQYAGGGNATFLIGPSPDPRHRQCVVAEITDSGPGIPDVASALRGVALDTGRRTTGISGSGRLVHRMAIEARPGGGTMVRLEMDIPRLAPELDSAALAAMVGQLARHKLHSPLEEVEQQNHELLEIHQQLREKQAELERSDQRKNQFITTLAHELRNPLATLDLSLALLRRKPEVDAAELMKRCDVMARQTAQLSQLVDDLMDAARVSQGKVELRKSPTDLNHLVMSAVEMTSAATQAKGHQVKVVAAPEPVWVLGDGPRLNQVLGNLLQNAARYTPDRGSIAVKVRQTRELAIVDVIDNGVGIAPDLIPHVFDLFVQGESPVAGGLGIGLALVRHLVADHGGSVEVASAGVNQGSRFTVTLPRLAQGDDAPAFEQVPSGSDGQQASAPPTQH